MDVSHIYAEDSTLRFTMQNAASADYGSSAEKRNPDMIKDDPEITAADRKLTSDFLQKTIDRANKQLYGTDQEVSYSLHEKTGQYMFKIIDRETKEIIREIPPEKTLDAVAKMWELAGILVDEKK